jgi:hypothetical protein
MQESTPNKWIPPQRYLAVGVVISGLLQFTRSRWPGSSIGLWSELIGSTLVGGWLLAWIAWRFLFPPR